MSRKPGDRIGRYVIDRRLGVGGMAEAYLAHQEGPAGFSKSVVIKVLHPQHAHEPEMVDLFLHEARVGARLNHANLVQIFDLGEADGQYFIAMEHVDGLTLLQAAKRCWAMDQGIPIDIAVRIVAAAAQGLHAAHSLKGPDGTDAGIIHRDISPDNIMIARDGTVKVLDFGVAKLRGSEGTLSGELKGKIPFMSPEQLNPESEIDGRTDLWALGVTLYWCLAGRRPFMGTSDVKTMRAIMEQEPPPLRQINKAVSPELEEVVMNLLEKDRNKRIASGAKLAARLQRLVPAAQHNPVARFMERMALFADDPPEARAKAKTGTGGLPATLSAPESTQVVLRDATADVQSLPSGETEGQPEGAAPDATLQLRRPAEDVPSTVRVPAPPQRPASRTPALAAAIGAALLVGVVAVVVLTGDGSPGEPDQPVAVTPDTPDTPTPATPVEPAPVEPAPVEATSDAPMPVEPDTRTPTTHTPSMARQRTVVLVAPPQVRWTTLGGKVLAQGSKTITTDEENLIAVDPARDGRTQLPVAARIDFNALPKGTLAVRVLPYATNVKLGPQALGATPVKPVRLTAGTYRVVVEKDKQTVTRTVKVKANDETLLTVDMRSAK